MWTGSRLGLSPQLLACRRRQLSDYARRHAQEECKPHSPSISPLRKAPHPLWLPPHGKTTQHHKWVIDLPARRNRLFFNSSLISLDSPILLALYFLGRCLYPFLHFDSFFSSLQAEEGQCKHCLEQVVQKITKPVKCVYSFQCDLPSSA
jgi:hypothetical protein